MPPNPQRMQTEKKLNLKAQGKPSYNNSPYQAGVTEYMNESEGVDMFMKPKGIEIFTPELAHSSAGDRQSNQN